MKLKDAKATMNEDTEEEEKKRMRKKKRKKGVKPGSYFGNPEYDKLLEEAGRY